jgi:hypothetical protein
MAGNELPALSLKTSNDEGAEAAHAMLVGCSVTRNALEKVSN